MFRNASWWVCSFFIGVFCYMFGTLTGLPTWSVTDTKLSVFSDMASGIAGVATLFAAIYAYKSFNSWEDRTKQQHKLERSSESLKELSRTYEQVMLELFRFCKQTLDTQSAKGFALSNGEKFIGDYLEHFENLLQVQNRFMDNLSSYRSAYSNHKCILGKETIELYSDVNILKFYDNLTSNKRQLTSKDIQCIITFHHTGTVKIEALFKELYATT